MEKVFQMEETAYTVRIPHGLFENRERFNLTCIRCMKESGEEKLMGVRA